MPALGAEAGLIYISNYRPARAETQAKKKKKKEKKGKEKEKPTYHKFN